jgi:hypothetical protein
MDRHDDAELDREITDSSTVGDGEHHATTGGAAAAGAVTGGVIGMTGGPVGAAIGAVGGAIIGAAAERMMHSDDDSERARAGFTTDQDGNPLIEDRAGGPTPVTGRVVEREFVDPTPVNRSPTDTPGGLTPHTSDLSRQDEDIRAERRSS